MRLYRNKLPLKALKCLDAGIAVSHALPHPSGSVLKGVVRYEEHLWEAQ